MTFKTSIHRLAFTAIAFAGFAATSPVRADAPPPSGVLSLSASASVDVAKDLLALTFSASRDGADANAVQAQLKTALDAALAEAKKVAKPGQVDVSTGNFQLFPRTAPKGGIAGWQGSAELVVEGRDIAAIGQLVGRITTMTVSRVSTRLSREAGQQVEGAVAANAIARYRTKAADYAKRFGYATVMIREVNVQTSESGPGPMPMMRMQASASSMSGEPLAVEAGKATVTATVSGTVQMK